MKKKQTNKQKIKNKEKIKIKINKNESKQTNACNKHKQKPTKVPNLGIKFVGQLT